MSLLQEDILRRIALVREGTDNLVKSFAYGRLVHDGFTLAIVGRPNVGKSSLFNRLLAQDRAIVTDIPGTTRDTVSRSREYWRAFRFDCSTQQAFGPVRIWSRNLESSAVIRQWPMLICRLVVAGWQQSAWTQDDRALIDRAASSGARYLIVRNKSDQPAADVSPRTRFRVSALTGAGIENCCSEDPGRRSTEVRRRAGIGIHHQCPARGPSAGMR